jgi:hypothetical protein
VKIDESEKIFKARIDEYLINQHTKRIYSGEIKVKK